VELERSRAQSHIRIHRALIVAVSIAAMGVGSNVVGQNLPKRAKSGKAPAWFSNLETYAFWQGDESSRQCKKELNRLKGIELVVVHIRSAPDTIKKLHKQGSRVISYISFYDTYVIPLGRGVFGRVPWDPKRPQILLMDKDHRFKNTPMDGVWRMSRYLVCNNTQEYVDAAIAAVRLRMERGADGIFIDNSRVREKCFGHGVHVGYRKGHGVVCERAAKKPGKPTTRKSRLLSRAVEKLPIHTHIYPDKSHDYAYGRLLDKVREVVREYGPDKIVVINGGLRFADRCDANLLESYVLSWAWKGRRKTWPELKKLADKYAPLVRSGHRILALDYAGQTDKSAIEDAVFAYAAARLSGFLWYSSTPAKHRDNRYERLIRLRLGKRLTELNQVGSVDYSVFEHAIIAINGGSRPQTAVIQRPPGFDGEAVEDLISGEKIPWTDGRIQVTVPTGAGRVYLTSRSLNTHPSRR